MKSRNLFQYLALSASLIYHSSCQQLQHQSTLNTVDSTVNTTVTSVHQEESIPSVSITEDFEQAASAKTSYTAAAVTFSSGRWILDDALLAASDADAKNGSHSIRIRNKGKISMQFDAGSVTSVSLMHGAYGSDGSSSWQLWVSEDAGSTYIQVGETVITEGHDLKEASFAIDLKHAVRLELRKVSGGKNRIDIDDLIIYTNGDTAAVSPAGTAVAEQHSHNHTSSHINMLLGNPSSAASNITNADNYLIDHVYYVESYNKSKAEPNWVSWHIAAADLGSTDRLNNFRQDTTLPGGWYQADNTSYRGSGFDKGHNCPSGDRTSSTEANSSTFLMDNIIPQAPNNNQHTWEHLESYCRGQVKKGNEVYVIMGSYGSGGTGRNGYTTTIDNGRINVPSHIWKVVIVLPEGNNDLQRINENTIVIAINTPNDNNIDPNWMNYTCTVRDIEKATGYNLLSALPKALQDVIEAKKFKGGN